MYQSNHDFDLEVDDDDFSWTTKGSKSGKPCNIEGLAKKHRVPGDRWDHVSMQANWPEKGMLRIRTSESRIAKSGNFNSNGTLIDMDEESARKLYEFLKGFYGQGATD